MKILKNFKNFFGSYYDTFSKGAIYLLAFLFPIFFLPWTSDALDFNKQAILILLVFISFFLWMFKTLATSKIQVSSTRLHIPVAVFFIVYALSTIFSSWRYGSFWGIPSIAEGLLSFICLFLLYLLICNSFSRRDVFNLYLVFILSSALALFYGVFQLFGRYIISASFAQNPSFNTIGTVSGLGIFAAIILPLIIFFLIVSKRVLRGLFFVALIAVAILLFLVNSFIAWLLVLVGSILVLTLGIQKKGVFGAGWLIFPMFFIAISLFFAYFNNNSFRIAGLPNRAVEIFLNVRTSMDIGLKTMKDKPFFGSGPGTFVLDFSKYKSAEFNSTSFWNTRFQAGYSKFLTLMATTGILGVISYLFLVVYAIVYAIISLFRKKGIESDAETLNSDKKLPEIVLWALGAGIFISFTLAFVSSFFYNSNLVIEFVIFMLLGSFVALFYPAKKEISLKPSSISALAYTFIVTIVFIFGFGVLIVEAQRYVGEAYYLSAIKSWGNGDFDKALGTLEKSVSVNYRVDQYWRDLSQLYLQKMNIEINKKDQDKDKLAQIIQVLINNSVNSAKMATDVDPSNVANWSVRGYVYQSLAGAINGAEDWSIKAYDEAIKLEPANPYFVHQQGIVYLTKALAIPEKERVQEKEGLLKDAKTRFEKALELKSDYAPARFQLSVVYQAQGKTDEAITELEEAKKISPFDTGLAFQLGLIYYQTEDLAKAKAELERAVAIDPNYGNAIYFLGLISDKENNKEKALAYFEQVLTLHPDNEEVKKAIENVKNGKPALEGIVQQNPPNTPIDETPAEVEKSAPPPPAKDNPKDAGAPTRARPATSD